MAMGKLPLSIFIIQSKVTSSSKPTICTVVSTYTNTKTTNKIQINELKKCELI